MPGCIAFADSSLGADRYFQMFPSEPLKAGGVVSVDAISELTNLLEMMEKIAKNNARNVLIVCHAVFSGQKVSGIRIPLYKGAGNLFLEADGMSLLGPGRQGSAKELEIAKQLRIPTDTLKKMQECAEKIRKSPPDRILIRGCEVALSPDVLVGIKSVFGSRYICAPTNPIFYGGLPAISPAEGAVNREKRAEWIAKQERVIEEDGVTWSIKQKYQYSLELRVWADSAQAFSRWVSKHFGNGKYSPGRALYWEGIRTETMVFPGDWNYRNYLSTG